MRDHRGVLASILVLSLMLIGCTGQSMPDDENATSPPDAGAATTDNDGPTEAAPEPSGDRSAGPPLPGIAPHHLDVDLVTGLGIERRVDEELRMYMRWFSVPDAEPLNEAMQAYADEAWDAYEQIAREGVDDDSGIVTPDLNVQTVLTASGPQILGIQMLTFQDEPSTDAARARTLWWDDGRLREPQDLFADDEAFQEFADAVVDASNEAGYGVAEGTDATSALTSITFDSSGDLVAEISEGTLTAAAAGSFQVAVPADGLLSEFGERAASAVTDPQPYGADAADPPSESPSPAPTTDPAPPSARVDCSTQACVALTFDDGPSSDLTAQLLGILDEHAVPATFFVLGQSVNDQPDLARQIVDGGHEIANHTWSHRDLATLDESAIRDEIETTSAVIEEVTGTRPTYVRPPYGSMNDAVQSAAGMPIITWDVDSQDWQSQDAAAVVDAVMGQVGAGSIVLLHDIHPSTVAAVPDLIDRLHSEGYVLVTVTDVLAGADLQPGQVYQRAP